MAAFDRTTIVRGPCKITYDGATFYSKGGVTLTVNQSSFDKQSDAYGLIGRGKTDMSVVVEFEPVGEIESLTVLFPYGATTIGAGIYSTTDKPLVIVATDATYTVYNAAITQMPSIRCTATNTAFGSVQFTGLRENANPDDTTEGYFNVGAGASIGTAFNPALVIAGPYTGSLGGGDPFFTEAGFDVSFDLSLTPIIVDGVGTVDMALANIGASASFVPTGISDDYWDSWMSSIIGQELITLLPFNVVTESIGGLNLNLASAQIIDVQRRFSPTENRAGTVNLVAKRTFTSGAPNALFTVAAVTA
jgi:hypothetical protein